jgi:hypothetical protein
MLKHFALITLYVAIGIVIASTVAGLFSKKTS